MDAFTKVYRDVARTRKFGLDDHSLRRLVEEVKWHCAPIHTCTPQSLCTILPLCLQAVSMVKAASHENEDSRTAMLRMLEARKGHYDPKRMFRVSVMKAVWQVEKTKWKKKAEQMFPGKNSGQRRLSTDPTEAAKQLEEAVLNGSISELMKRRRSVTKSLSIWKSSNSPLKVGRQRFSLETPTANAKQPQDDEGSSYESEKEEEGAEGGTQGFKRSRLSSESSTDSLALATMPPSKTGMFDDESTPGNAVPFLRKTLRDEQSPRHMYLDACVRAGIPPETLIIRRNVSAA